ncbi:MAG TPA: transcription-repair coupling factor, partial [bacterium]|nr:transcription-repair coupling factor [bacterium]
RQLDEMAARLPFPPEFAALLRAHYGDPVREYDLLRAGLVLELVAPGSDTRQGFFLAARACPPLAAATPAAFAEQLAATRGRWQHIAVVTPPDREPELLAAALRAHDFTIAASAAEPGVQLIAGALPAPLAVELPEAGLLFAAPVPPPRRALRPHQAWRHSDDSTAITALFDLVPGDYVVHLQFGIGQYLQLDRLETAGMAGDYLKIAYAGGDMLYVPVDKLHLIHKYVGPEREPTLNKMRGGTWGAVARRLQASVRDLAGELLALHAERLATPGHAYPVATPDYEQFVRRFPHEETFDQGKAISAVLQDLATPRPMDRLVCGDVGFGKTEVALRAAFTVMAGGRQVAFLCPTTLLAQQHYHTCRTRLRGFPFTVEVLSRFKRVKEQQRVIALAKRGDVDLLIGTHRLLSADVGFLDLGLVIIDEEQRFGVRHKERLKSLRALVDVLTLTATPIPRTLNLSLAGLRDISVIETPPPAKQAVLTRVFPFDAREEQAAIEAELARGGQVFYVFNRIEGLDGIAREVRERYPQARIATAHGQLPEDELEDIMAAFLHGDYDILVTTAIIESGLDLPRVNTLIVRDAHRFGLADLYQLRGRVGRGKVRATALFFYPPTLPLTETTRERLEAIESFTELGAGFQLALRDMEIRGAGNVLGDAQSGLISAVGIPLYAQLLEDEVARREGRTTRSETSVTLQLPVPAGLPESYISDERARLKLYKRLAQCIESGHLAAMRAELADRFGPLPPETENLLQLTAVRQAAEQLGLAAVTLASALVGIWALARRRTWFTLGVVAVLAGLGGLAGWFLACYRDGYFDLAFR